MNLLNIKKYVIIALVFAVLLQSWRLNNAQHERDTLQNTINHAQAEYKRQTELLRLREQEAAISAKQSQKRMDNTMSQPVPADCQMLFDWMIHQAVHRDA
jgi:uncharacterized membrane protein (DUF106 family)